MSDLDLHDPGGRVRHTLRDGVYGEARFWGVRQEYRYLLTRWWGCEDVESEPFVLWIGTNPSVANAFVNDPTATREVNFTKAWSYRRYIKMNVVDWRATKPRDLLSVEPRSPKNLPAIIEFAQKADKVVACWGLLHKRLRPYADDVIAALDGVDMQCLGYCKDGVSPRHPLYLKADSVLMPFRSAA